MTHTIYVQALNRFPISDWALSAYLGFKEKGANVKYFEFIEDVPLSRNNIIVGYIEDTEKYLKALGAGELLALNIPKEIESYTQRNIRYMTVGEFKKDSQLPVFVKSGGRHKEFMAGVITKESSRAEFFADVADDVPALISDVIDIASEYRCYIIDGELKGIKHYMGDIRIFPDVSVMDAAINDFKSQPAGYSMDFGITREGKTVLIECNDGYSLGNYGLRDDLYSTLLAKRWMQIVSSIK